MRRKYKIKELQYNKVCSCSGSLTMSPQSTYLTCTHTLPHAVPTLGAISLVCLGPRIDHIQNKYFILWCFSMEQTTSDSQILSVTQLLQTKSSCTPLKRLYRMDSHIILLGRETVRISSDCHSKDWSFEAYFILGLLCARFYSNPAPVSDPGNFITVPLVTGNRSRRPFCFEALRVA